MIVGLLLLIAALVFVLFHVYEAYSAGQNVAGLVYQLENYIEEKQEDENASAAVAYYGEQTPDGEMPTVEIDGYLYIGMIEIPSLDLVLPVMTDWSYEQLQISPCRYAGSVYSNDFVICGHNYRSHFSRIKFLNPGTEAVFTDVEGNEFRYTLSYLEVIAPGDTDVMTEADDNWDLTLFTCTTGGTARMALRFVLNK